jgi:hypothetical protein
MAKDIFEAFDGQQDAFGYSQATRVGDTVYVAGTVGIGEGMHIPESMAEQMELAYRNVADTLAHFAGAVAGSTRGPPSCKLTVGLQCSVIGSCPPVAARGRAQSGRAVRNGRACQGKAPALWPRADSWWRKGFTRPLFMLLVAQLWAQGS